MASDASYQPEDGGEPGSPSYPMRQIFGSLPISLVRPFLAISKRVKRNVSMIYYGQGEEELEEEFQQLEEDIRHEKNSPKSSPLNILKYLSNRIIAISVLAYTTRTNEY